jgi:hypothetical protein
MTNFTLLFIVSLINPVLAYNNGQFKQFYAGGWDSSLFYLLDNECKEEYSILQAHPEEGGWDLVSCFLDNFSEIRKTEMAISSIVLGLLPMAIQFVGPTIADIAVLGMRRPLLAMLISMGSTCATLQNDHTGLETVRVRGEKRTYSKEDILWPEKLIDARIWAKALISVFEYVLVGSAAANSIVQGYQLSFWAISFISTAMGTFGFTAEAFSPLLWIFLPVPIQALSTFVLYLGRASGASTLPQLKSDSVHRTHWCSSAWVRVKNWLVQETTPHAFRKNETATRPEVLKKSTRYWMVGLNWAIKLMVWVQVVYGTIVLSSVLFVSVFVALQIVGRFLAGAIVCRVVVEFEMYGLREVSKLHE